MPTRTKPQGIAKRPFNASSVLARIRRTLAHGSYADAAMFELRDIHGYDTVFQQLVACILSIRTRDEVTLPVALRLLEHAPTAAALAQLTEDEIDDLIREVTFHRDKAATITAIAQRTRDEFGGELPADFETLTSFRGVGPKCANLALGVAASAPRISVDIHVHRVTNRWGIVATRTPEQTMTALEDVLPKKYWIEINRLLVPFGKHICTGTRPKCSTCPVLEYCQQVGVTNPR